MAEPINWCKLREKIYLARGKQEYGVIVAELVDGGAVLKRHEKPVEWFATFEEATEYVEQNWGNI